MTHSPDEERDGRAFDFSAPLKIADWFVVGATNSGDDSEPLFDSDAWPNGAEGAAIADALVRRWNGHREMLEALVSLEAALRKDSREKSVLSETVEYHLDGQAMYQAINKARAAITKAGL